MQYWRLAKIKKEAKKEKIIGKQKERRKIKNEYTYKDGGKKQ